MSITEVKQALKNLGGSATSSVLLQEYIKLHYTTIVPKIKTCRDNMAISIYNAVRSKEIFRYYQHGQKDIYYLPEALEKRNVSLQ